MKIAVIGGIGSGKSEVCKVANELGFKVVSADEINKEMLQDKVYLKKLELEFPKAFYHGKLDKQVLANEVFSDKEKRLALNGIAHPEIAKRILSYEDENLVVELPLILESGCASAFEKSLLVDTKFFLRLKRLKGRGVPYNSAIKIMKAQAPISELRNIATEVITNNGHITELREKAKKYFENLK